MGASRSAQRGLYGGLHRARGHRRGRIRVHYPEGSGMRYAPCPRCRGTGSLVGYNRAPVEAVYLCLHCGGRFTAPLARAEVTA